ncbi:hypothetical protein Tco_0077988 [Tanacetum coccineum]
MSSWARTNWCGEWADGMSKGSWVGGLDKWCCASMNRYNGWVGGGTKVGPVIAKGKRKIVSLKCVDCGTDDFISGKVKATKSTVDGWVAKENA